MDTTRKASSEWRRRRVEWAAAFASQDPARQWAAACSVARMVAAGDRWTDSTALHEAACGAYDAALGSDDPDPVAAAVTGARRALYWERRARLTVVPPVSMAEHRWRAQPVSANATSWRLEPLEAAENVAVAGPGGGGPPDVSCWLTGLLHGAGWSWPVRCEDAVRDAVDMVGLGGRRRASGLLREMHPELPAPVTDGLVLLVAGSRPLHGRHGWPGVVWLHAHYGAAVAAADPGARAVIDSVVSGRRSRPASVVGAALDRPPSRTPRHRPAMADDRGVMPVERAEAIAS
jgi:hypothetical protein